jgi:hypothetical protein
MPQTMSLYELLIQLQLHGVRVLVRANMPEVYCTPDKRIPEWMPAVVKRYEMQLLHVLNGEGWRWNPTMLIYTLIVKCGSKSEGDCQSHPTVGDDEDVEE